MCSLGFFPSFKNIWSVFFFVFFFVFVYMWKVWLYKGNRGVGVFTNDGNQKLVFYPGVPLFMMKMRTENTVAGGGGN